MEELPGGTWSEVEELTVDAAPMNLPISPSIAVDSGDREHVYWYQAFYDDCMYWLGEAVYYKTRESGAWVDRSTLLQGHVGVDTDLAIDWHGEPVLTWAEEVEDAHDVMAMFYRPSSDAPTTEVYAGTVCAYPNPFRSDVAIRLDGAKSLRSAVEILDISGRIVARLELPAEGTGRQILRWDGTTGGGRIAPAGSYLIRALASDGWRTLRIVRLE